MCSCEASEVQFTRKTVDLRAIENFLFWWHRLWSSLPVFDSIFFSFDLTLCLLLFLNVDQRLKESRSINFGLIDWIVVTHL